MENLKSLERTINSELTSKIISSNIKHNQIYINIEENNLTEVILFLKTNSITKFRQLIEITAVDYPEKDQIFRMVYLLLSHESNSRIIIDYYIEKVGKKNLRTGHVKVDIDFWMVDETGESISLNGDQRRTTQNNIKKVIGSYDDFILTSMSSQNNSTVFSDKTQKERKELLAQFMGLKIFDR